MTRRMLSLLALALPILVAPAPPGRDEPASGTKKERLLKLYRGEAAGYVIYRDSTRRERVELRPDPAYFWTNPLRNAGQDGAVFLWTCRGRAEALGSIFSSPVTGPRQLIHELHSLSLSVLDVSREGANTWTPEGPGIVLAPIVGAAAPARTPVQRLAQMRGLTREFSGHTADREGVRWELRLLPQPFYRYESTDPEVVDGAVFAFVTSAGTDPEAILVIEARRPSAGAAPVWQFGLARFTDLHLWVRHKGTDVFSVPMIVLDQPRQDEKHRYRLFKDRAIDAIEDIGDKPAPGVKP